MAKRIEFQVGDEIEFLRDDPEKRFNEQKVYKGTIDFIASCRRWVSVYPHNFPILKDPLTKEEIHGSLIVEGNMFTPQCAAGKKL